MQPLPALALAALFAGTPTTAAAQRVDRAAPVAPAASTAAVADGQRAEPLTQSAPEANHGFEATLFRAFPEADGYRCIRRDVDQDARVAVEQRLPFKVHFNELGEHTLVVAFRGRRPVGLVYVRSEEGEWGLVDIAWHLTLDRRVLGFEYVRGHTTNLHAFERSQFARDITGADFDKVAALLHRLTDGKPTQRKQGSEALAVTTLRSAAKTLAVVETVWLAEVEKLHDQATGYDLFPAAARFSRRTGAFDLDQQRVEVKVVFAYDLGETLLGAVIWTESRLGDEPLTLRWVVDRELRAIRVTTTSHERNVALRQACASLDGQPLPAPVGADERLVSLARGLGAVVEQLAVRRIGR